MNENNVQVITADALEVLNRSEIDTQIATAKRYPRNIDIALARIQDIAARDAETAADCFYTIPRDGSKVDGLSVRMAEIIATSWGNLRAQARIIGDDGKTITAQGVAHDLETNVAISVEVKMGVVYGKNDKKGRTGQRFSDDMVVTTSQAACAKAFRNAVLKVVPKAVTNQIIERIRQVSVGAINADLLKRRTMMLNWYRAKNIDINAVFYFLGVDKEDLIDADMVMKLHSLATAIKDNETTVEESLIKPYHESLALSKGNEEKNENKKRVSQAMQQQG